MGRRLLVVEVGFGVGILKSGRSRRWTVQNNCKACSMFVLSPGLLRMLKAFWLIDFLSNNSSNG